MFLSVLKGAAVAGVGAALAYVYQYVTATDLGQFGPLVAAALAVAANVVRKAGETLAGKVEADDRL
jgi:hypothetical protein